MNNCPKCNSTRLNKRGTRFARTKNVEYRMLHCRDCGNRFQYQLPTIQDVDITQVSDSKKYILTSYQLGTQLNHEFLHSLIHYAKHISAELIILTENYDEEEYEPEDDGGILMALSPYIRTKNFSISDDLNVFTTLKIPPTSENPLTGLDGLSKGKSLVVGHPVLQYKTLPVFGDSNPIMMHTTGSISVPDYNMYSKSGAKAEHNHSYSGLMIELDGENDLFHFRILNADETGGFYDIEYYASKDGVTKHNTQAEAIVLGDTHVTEQNEDVYNATFKNNDSIINTLKPKVIVHHDLLDFGLKQSHHLSKSVIGRYKKMIEGKDSVVAELNTTSKYLVDNTPDFVEEVVIVASNHNDHLTKYLENIDIKFDLKNAKIYHYLFYMILSAIEKGIEVNPFEFYFNEFCRDTKIRNKIKFLGREDLYYIKDILLSTHGDVGTGGQRYSQAQGKRYPKKLVTGHSHCFADGHSALTKDGWKSIKDIVVGEFVLSYDHNTNSNIWVENRHTHKNKYTGVMLNVNTQYIKQIITPNHNFFTKTGEYVNASQLILTKSPEVIPLSSNGIMDSQDFDKYTDEDIKKIVAVCADGSLIKMKNTSNYDIRFHLKKERKISRLRELFGNDITSYENAVSKKGSIKFTISRNSKSSVDINNFLSSGKEIPSDFINLSKRQKELFIDELSHWDGTFVKDDSRNGRQWSTTCQNSMKVVSTIITELGYRASMYSKKQKNPNHRDKQIVSWCVDRQRQWHKKNFYCGKSLSNMWGVQQIVVDDIDVYCLTTDVNNFWVKNDITGKVSLTGNSPSISCGAYCVGTMTGKLEYQHGSPTGNMNTHCIIYPNGKRQLINIIKGCWKV